jgi:hypothetical protein
MGHAKTRTDPSGRSAAVQRREYFRVTTRLRFTFVPARQPPHPWLEQATRPAAFFLRPSAEELARAHGCLAGLPRRTITLSEGGMRVRFPDPGRERSLLASGDPGGGAQADVLLEVAVRDETVLFRLPVHLLRVDPYPWAPFAAFAFGDLPEAIQQRLEALVVAIHRQRLRRRFFLYDEDEMAAQLWRVEAAAAHRPRRERPNPWVLRNRFFP